MSKSILIIAALVSAAPATTLRAETVLAVVSPATGPFAALGAQIRAGAGQLGAEKKIRLVQIGESCEPGSGDAIAKEIVAAKATAAIGFLCTDSLETAGERLKAASIPAISV